jgi:abortive infection bacteriophage resistance protein
MPLTEAHFGGCYFVNERAADMVKFTKQPLSFEQQADLLIHRGMIADRDELISRLTDVSYYRLSGYWHAFLTPNDTFVPNTSLQTVWNTYTFDRRFRLLTLDAIERVEVYVRTALANEMSMTQGAFGYLDRKNLPGLTDDRYKQFIKKAANSHKTSRETFAKHFNDKYGSDHTLPPYWVLVEMIDFGQTVRLYQGASKNVQVSVADRLGITPIVMSSWLKTLQVVRNSSAHHTRLWNRIFGFKPIIPKKDSRWNNPEPIANDRVFCILTMLSMLLENIAHSSSWQIRLISLLNEYPEVPLKNMGFPDNWGDYEMWENVSRCYKKPMSTPDVQRKTTVKPLDSN